MIQIVGFLVAIGIATAVASDASRLGAKRGRLGGGLLDMGPVGWFFVCLISVLIGLICYRVARRRLLAVLAGEHYAPPGGYPRNAPPPTPHGQYPPAPYPPAPYPPSQYPPHATPPEVMADPPERLRGMVESGEISQWELNAMNRWRRS